jgi:small GTP-binding protein
MHAMITKLKVCLIGATGVGKTSLASRYVHSIFSETYRTTIGVRIEAKEVRRPNHIVQLVIWDLSGEDEFQSVQPTYVAGAAGYLLVLDSTRPETVDTGMVLVARMHESLGDVPFVVVVNKADLGAACRTSHMDLAPLGQLAYAIVETSARTGAGVEHAFEALVDAIFAELEPRPRLEGRWT